jgi:TP901 family phage tail tape measure protein
LGLNSLGLGYTFTAKDLASGTIQRLRQSFTDLDKTSDEVANNIKSRLGKDMAKGAATGAIGAGSIALVNQAGKAYANYEESLAGAAMMTGTTKDRMGQLNDAIRKTNFEGLYTSKEAADAVAELGSAGLDAKQAMIALKPTMDLATVSMGRMGLADAANVGTTVLAAFGEETEKLTLRNAQLVVAAKETKFGFRDFETALRHAAPMAKTAGQEFESMIAYLGMMRDIGNDAATSATAYKEALSALTTKSRTQNMFQQIGVKIFDESTGKVRDMAAIMRDTIPIVEKMTDKDRIFFVKQALGSRGMKIYTGTVASYTKALKEGKVQQGDWIGRHTDLVAKLKSGQGEMSAQLDVYRSTSAYQRKEISKMWDEFKVSMGQSFLPAIMPVLRGLRSLTRGLVDMANTHPSIGRFLGKLMALGGAALVVVGALKILSAAFGMIALGRYIAAQAAAAAATTATTTAIVAQGGAATAAAGATSKMGMAVKGLGTLAMVAGLVYTMRNEIEELTYTGLDALTGRNYAAERATNKYGDALMNVNWKMGVAISRQEEYRDSLRKSIDEIVNGAKQSEKHAGASLLKLADQYGVLRKQIDEQRKIEDVANKSRDLKGEEAAKQKIYELENKSKVIQEAQLRISADAARKQLGGEKDPTKRKALQGTIWASESGEYLRKEGTFEREKKKQMTNINLMDSKPRALALVAAEKKWAEQEDALKSERTRLGGMARGFGLQTKGGEVTRKSLGVGEEAFQKAAPDTYHSREYRDKATAGVGAQPWIAKMEDFMYGKWMMGKTFGKEKPIEAGGGLGDMLDKLTSVAVSSISVGGKKEEVDYRVQNAVEVTIKIERDQAEYDKLTAKSNTTKRGRNGKVIPRGN